MRTVRISQRKRAASIIRRMTTGDVFQLLACLSRRHLAAIDTLARATLLEHWPAVQRKLLKAK